MPINPRLLNEGERVLVSTRTHPKALIGPFLVTAATIALGCWAIALVDNFVVDIAVAAVGAIVIIWLGVLPFLRWLTTSYTFTDRRFMTRTGLIAKTGRTVPLNRISGIDIEIGVIDRIFGCGTLVITDASAGGAVPVHDIPHVERVQLVVSDELAGARDERRDDGT